MNIWKTAVTDGAIQTSKEAVTLCITMLGVMTLWTGVLEIGHRSGLVDQLAGRMGPILTFLFPRLDPDGEARKQISVNVTANILGLGGTGVGRHAGRVEGHGGAEKGGGGAQKGRRGRAERYAWIQQMKGGCGNGSMRRHIPQPDLIMYNVVRILNCRNYFLCFC